ncbi:MAG TPA: PrsW family intramembrane metalloprotease [Anaerolineaceae bacterium]
MIFAVIGALFFAFVPNFILALVIYWFDRYEKEPKILLGAAFIWGAIVAAGGAFILNTVFGVSVFLVTGSEGASNLLSAVVSAPIVEESLKGFAVLLVFLVFRKEFDSILDGIVYAAVTALGFAATENFLYIYEKGYLASGWEGFWLLVFVRVVVVAWQHPFYTSFTGIGLAIARLNRKTWVKIIAPIGGLFVAMSAHAIHNLSASLGVVLLCLAQSIVDWIGWLAMFGFILYLVYREKKWLTIYLQEEIQLGTITQRQFQVASSWFGQIGARFSAVTSGKYGATDKFYQLCGELAHKKRQLATLGEERGNSRIIASLRQELRNLSSRTI